MSSSFAAAQGLVRVTALARQLSAIELMLGAQAVELRELGGNIAPAMARTVETVRLHSPALAEDRALASDINTLADAIAGGAFNQP